MTGCKCGNPGCSGIENMHFPPRCCGHPIESHHGVGDIVNGRISCLDCECDFRIRSVRDPVTDYLSVLIEQEQADEQ